MTYSLRASVRPRLWIVAGPNGSGKSSAYDQNDVGELGGSVWIINPDLLTARIQVAERVTLQAANLEAVKRIERWLEASLDAHQTIGVETVLSTDKYRRLVERAKERRFEVRLVYVFLRSAELQIERIRLRVAKGGHHVLDDKVRSRRERSLEQLSWFFAAADEAWLYDNSADAPAFVGKKEGDEVWFSADIPSEVLDRLPR